VIFPGVDGPTPTIYWEFFREGVDDCRYVTTLQQHIRQAKERGAIEVAQQAQRVLEPLLAADAPEINTLADTGGALPGKSWLCRGTANDLCLSRQ
jgi:hypothetical protein